MTWTVADGVRGRRWRASLQADGTLVASVLLETAPDGTLRKLEVTTAAGLLTLHPDGSTLHGNIARVGGLDHVTLPWTDRHILVLTGSPVTAAAAARTLGERVGVGEGHTVAAVSIDADLIPRPSTFRVARVTERRWRFIPAAGGRETVVTVDDDGIPLLDAGITWPLELDQRT